MYRVQVDLMGHPLLAEQETRKGIRRLAMIALADALQWQFRILPHLDKLVQAIEHPMPHPWNEDKFYKAVTGKTVREENELLIASLRSDDR